MKIDFEDMAKVPEQKFEFTRVISSSGPYKMIPLNFKTREDWLKHAENIIDGLNLNCIDMNTESDRCKFQFGNQKDLLVFDLAVAGDAPYTPEVSITEDFDDPRFAEFWISTAKKYFLDKNASVGIQLHRKSGSALDEVQAQLTFGRKRHHVSFIVARDDIRQESWNKFVAEHPKAEKQASLAP